MMENHHRIKRIRKLHIQKRNTTQLLASDQDTDGAERTRRPKIKTGSEVTQDCNPAAPGLYQRE